MKDNVVGCAGAGVVGGIIGLVGGYILSRCGQPQQVQSTQQPQQLPAYTENQTYTFPDGITEIRITFPEGCRYVEQMHLKFTPTLDIDGTLLDVGTLYIIIKRKDQMPEVFLSKFVRKNVSEEITVNLNDYLEMIIVRVRVSNILSKLNNAEVVLTKR